MLPHSSASDVSIYTLPGDGDTLLTARTLSLSSCGALVQPKEPQLPTTFLLSFCTSLLVVIKGISDTLTSTSRLKRKHSRGWRQEGVEEMMRMGWPADPGHGEEGLKMLAGQAAPAGGSGHRW